MKAKLVIPESAKEVTITLTGSEALALQMIIGACGKDKYEAMTRDTLHEDVKAAAIKEGYIFPHKLYGVLCDCFGNY
ncbi:hypothetical protein N9955_00495 [bacterium]|nr:hypothetical protein [bacterium]